jgi:hypothetical protein
MADESPSQEDEKGAANLQKNRRWGKETHRTAIAERVLRRRFPRLRGGKVFLVRVCPKTRDGAITPARK